MLTQEQKNQIIKKYRLHDKDSGSCEVQIALISERIKSLVLHLKSHPKDLHSKRGLLKMIGKRRALLKYLKREDPERYYNLIKKLGLKK